MFLSDLFTTHEPQLHKSLQFRQATFRFIGSLQILESRIETMNRCASQRRGPDRGSATRSLPGSWEEFHEIFALWTLNLVGTARCAVRAALSGAMMPPAASRAGTSQRDVPTEVRFMGR